MSAAGPSPSSDPDRRLAILGFHKIGAPPPAGWESWFYVPEATFARHLAELRDGAWEVIDVARFLLGLESPHTLPERSALLTFDDGYRSVRQVALPWLQRFGFPAVLFVPTDFVGGRNTFDEGVEPDEPLCDWEDLRALARAGVSVQSHAASHRRFSELSRSERERERVESKAALEDHLGSPVEVIAFPYGDPGPAEEEGRLAAAGYRAACLYGGGPLRLPAENAFRLERVAMGPDTDLRAELARRP